MRSDDGGYRDALGAALTRAAELEAENRELRRQLAEGPIVRPAALPDAVKHRLVGFLVVIVVVVAAIGWWAARKS